MTLRNLLVCLVAAPMLAAGAVAGAWLLVAGLVAAALTWPTLVLIAGAYAVGARLALNPGRTP